MCFFKNWFRKDQPDPAAASSGAIDSFAKATGTNFILESMGIEDQRLWLRHTLDLLPKPFFLLNFEEKRVSYTNRAAQRMMGLEYENNPASKVYGVGFSLYRTDGSLVPAELLPSARVLRRERVDGEEFLLITRAGEFNIKVFAEDIPSMHGQPAAALIVFQDITALKKKEFELRQAQVDLKEAVEIAQVGFWNVDTATRVTTLSPQLKIQFGLDPDQHYDDALAAALDMIHNEDRARVIHAIEQSMANQTPYHIEYRVVHKSGQTRWIEARSGVTDGRASDQSRFTGTTLDITERVLSRLALENSSRELRTLSDSMPQIVWSADSAGSLDYFNQVWFDYCGTGVEENIGAGWTKYVHPEDLPVTIERWRRSLVTNEPYENEFRLRNHEGEYRWFFARARPIFEDTVGPSNRVVKKWYGTNTDIHEQKLLTEKLEATKNLAERANSAKSQFLANMSHEIRTPLGAIMGFSELIKDNGLGRVDREEYLSVIERNSSQLLRIIDDILDLSKVEAGMMLIEHIDFSLPELITDFSSLMGFKAREKGIQFTSKAVTTLPDTVNCDPTRLRQILMNVVGNAIKFTDQGRVELRVSYVDEFLDFEIEDTGRGISNEQEKNLFQPFTQADASTTRKYGGTGLGLVLSRSLAEALGGHFILKQSELERGSIFSVRVKAPAGSNAKFFTGLGFETAPVRTLGTLGQLSDHRVLLVEDSPDNQALISIFLGRAGARVDIATDGEQGMKMAMTGQYDVVLMDVQMPIMDGITAVKRLRLHGYAKAIIALTAHAMKEERIRCLEAGFSDFLSKPVNREQLINAVANFATGQDTHHMPT